MKISEISEDAYQFSIKELRTQRDYHQRLVDELNGKISRFENERNEKKELKN